MTRFKILIAILAAMSAISGCGSETQTIDANYMKNAEEIGKTRREVFLNTPSKEFDQMSAEDKTKYLGTFGGNETNARNYWEAIKNPPSGGPPIPKTGG